MIINRKIIIAIISVLLVGCNSNTETYSNKNIDEFSFSVRNGSKIYYNSLDSLDGSIVLHNDLIVNFSIGYFKPPVLKINQHLDRELKDTIENLITMTLIQARSNTSDILFYAWDTTNKTTMILNEERYMGITMSASNLNEKQKTLLLGLLDTLSVSK